MTEKSFIDFLGLKERNEYHRALGEFVSEFAAAENSMQISLRLCAGVSQPMAAALFSGTRTESAASYIRRIGETEKWPDSKTKELDYVFQQLTIINRVRNDILHYGAMPISENKLVSPLGADEWLVSTKLVAHTSDKIRETRITPEILRHLTSDLTKIRIHMKAIFDVDSEKTRHVSRQVLERAWLYKPSGSSDTADRPPRKTRKQPPPHGSSLQ